MLLPAAQCPDFEVESALLPGLSTLPVSMAVRGGTVARRSPASPKTLNNKKKSSSVGSTWWQRAQFDENASAQTRTTIRPLSCMGVDAT